MARRYKKLRGNTTTRTPRYCLFVDTEAFVNDTPTGTSQSFRLGTAIFVDRCSSAFAEKRYSFRTLQEFYEIIGECANKAQKLFIFAHNQKYDFVQLRCADWMIRLGYEAKGTPLIMPRFIKATYRRKEPNGRISTVEFRDSGNVFLGTPLADIGVALGIPKLEHEENWNNIPDEELTTYCMRDSEILMRAMCFYFTFISENDLGNCRPTISGQAYEAFKHRFMGDTEIVISTTDNVNAMARAAYKGARNDAWFIGDTSAIAEIIYQLDKNSLYGSVMADNVYPTEYICCTFGKRDSDDLFLHDTERGFVSIADVEIETSEPVFPITMDDRTIYPVGTYATTLTQPELEYAVEHHLIKRWLKRNIYKSARIFRDYIEFFNGLKERYTSERDLSHKDSEEYNRAEFMRSMSKAFITNLYGKFGQRAMKMKPLGDTEDTGSIEEYDHDTGKAATVMAVSGRAFTVEKGGESTESMPEIAAFVTAYGRMEMWRIMNIAGEGHYYYMDTDSLYTDEYGYTKLSDAGEVHPWEMGKLKIEALHKHVEIRTVKDLVKYCTETPVYGNNGEVVEYIPATDVSYTLKGVPRRAKRMPDGKYVAQKFSSMREGLENGMTTTRTTEYELSHDYDKGNVGLDGRTIPYELKNGVKQ